MKPPFFYFFCLAAGFFADFCYSQPQLQKIADNLNNPVYITHANDGSGRLFIVEKGGVIKIYRKGKILKKSFLDISRLISNSSEQGLLGLAFHPKFKRNHRFYVNYTNKNGDTRIVEYRTDKNNSNIADVRSRRSILTVGQPYDNHNGGAIEFGKDGYLYIALGDGGSANDPQNYAQNLSSLLGKILRIDVNARRGYKIPSSNPFVNTPAARGEIFAYGLRNPWRISFDPATGILFAGDVGQDDLEEVDIISAGRNYGWRIMEGNICNIPSSGCDQSGLTSPIATYDHTEGFSITGGYLYRGTRLPDLTGKYIFADFGTGTIWKLTQVSESNWVREVLISTNLSISSIARDPKGEQFVVDYSGTIYRLT